MSVAGWRAIVDAKLDQQEVASVHFIQHDLPAILNEGNTLPIKIKEAFTVAAHGPLNEVHPGAHAASADGAVPHGNEVGKERGEHSTPAPRARSVSVGDG